MTLLRQADGGQVRFHSVRGSVLLIVLITLLFTSFALVLLVEQASTDLLVESRAATARRLRSEAYSALEVTLATLENFRQANGALHSPAEGWADPLGFAGWTPREGCTAEVTLEDESGKLPLARADTATLVNLFKSWEIPQADAERLADGLLGWMKPDYVPVSGIASDYDREAIPYSPPSRPLRSFSELAAIDYVRDMFFDEQGRPNDRWQRFTAAFSLYNYQQLNLNAVSPDVLAALGFSDPAQQQRLRDFLAGTGAYSSQGPGWFKSAADATSVLGSAALPASAGAQIRALRVRVTLREGRSEFRLVAVVAPAGGATIVTTTATSGTTAASGSATAGAAVPAATTSNPAPALNYPFTLLEIQENPEIPPVPVAPPSA